MSMVPVSPLLLWRTVDKQVAAVGPHTEAKAHRFPAVTEEKAACPQGLLQGLQNLPPHPGVFH